MTNFRLSRITHHAPRFTAPLIFIAALALYLRTTCPTLGGGWDSEEFQSAAYTLAIAHSTGYPLYLILGKIFTTLAPIGNIAYRMNALSAILTALAVVFVYLNARLLTKHDLAAVATTALFATNAAVWRQAGVASVGPLNLLLLSALVYALLLWRARPSTSLRSAQGTPLTVAAFIFGLGLAHHRTILFLAPAIAIFVLLTDPGIIRRPREWARALFWLAFPLALYLYIPICGSAEGFFNYVTGSEAGNYARGNWLELGQAFASILQYLFESFGILGILLIGIGVVNALPQFNRAETRPVDARIALFLGLSVLTYIAFATLVSGEPDRYLVLPFVFLIYWFAIGIDTLENALRSKSQNLSVAMERMIESLRLTLAFMLLLMVILPLPGRLRAADWSAFDHVYEQWDEIFTLPIPQNATIVGNWSQLNAMRYMQRVEQRRPDTQAIGTLYDPAPQTDAARAAFAEGRAIFLAPGIAQPIGDYRYAQLGPLLEVRDKPQMNAPAAQKNIAINPSLTLANCEITTALEPYAPTTRIAPTRSARITFDWQANGSVKDFLVRVRVYDPDGRAIAQKDEPPVRGLYAPPQWARGEYVRDVHNIQIPGGTPPGTYQLKLQTLDAATKSPTSDEIAFGSFAVERATNLTREQVFIGHPLDLALDDHIALWGYGGFESARRAGEAIGGNLVFYALEDVGADLMLTFALLDTSDKTARTWQVAPITFYPMREWKQGEVLKAYYDLRDLPVGAYALMVGFDSQHLTKIVKLEIAPLIDPSGFRKPDRSVWKNYS
ncbi:MAG: DUF2723 domain-containing protein, partial [Chloroflexota bacterium]